MHNALQGLGRDSRRRFCRQSSLLNRLELFALKISARFFRLNIENDFATDRDAISTTIAPILQDIFRCMYSSGLRSKGCGSRAKLFGLNASWPCIQAGLDDVGFPGPRPHECQPRSAPVLLETHVLFLTCCLSLNLR